jgi:hypothetical protein
MDIVWLARSLGFHIHWRQVNRDQLGTLRPYLVGTISGTVEDIPCKLARKRPSLPSAQKFKDILWYGLRDTQPKGVRELYHNFVLASDNPLLNYIVEIPTFILSE